MSLNFDEILEKHYDEIFHYVRKQLNNQEDAKDLTQDIFLKVYEKQHTYRNELSSPRTWIYSIAHNIVVNHFQSSYQKKKNNLDQLDMEKLPSEFEPLEALIQKENVDEILLLMKKLLNSKHLHIMNLYFFSELTIGEISQTFRIPKQTVSNCIQRSIQKIQKEIRGDHFGPIQKK